MFPSWGPVAVFGIVLNINFLVVIAANERLQIRTRSTLRAGPAVHRLPPPFPLAWMGVGRSDARRPPHGARPARGVLLLCAERRSCSARCLDFCPGHPYLVQPRDGNACQEMHSDHVVQ